MHCLPLDFVVLSLNDLDLKMFIDHSLMFKLQNFKSKSPIIKDGLFQV